MIKLVKCMAIFLMIVGMVTTVFAESDTNVNEVMAIEVSLKNTIENVNEQRSEDIVIRKITLEKTSTAEIVKPVLMEENFAEVLAMEETVAEENLAEEITSEEAVVEETTAAEKYSDYHTGILTARKGYITDSPCGPNGNDGYETWYPTYPGGAVKILERECGFSNLKMEVCREEGPRNGVRILSGTMPNGEVFEGLIVVAADIKCKTNPDAAFERGQLIETSLGPGIIVDYCERAVNERKYNGRTHIDIATDWYN